MSIYGLENITFGMREGELLEGLKAAGLRPVRNHEKFDNIYADYVLEGFAVGKDQFKLYFQMSNYTHQLTQILLQSESEDTSKIDTKKLYRVVNELEGVYGDSIERRGMTSGGTCWYWDLPDFDVSVEAIFFKDIASMIAISLKQKVAVSVSANDLKAAATQSYQSYEALSAHEMLDDFWRSAILQSGHDMSPIPRMWEDFVRSLAVQTSYMPKAEQDAFIGQVLNMNVQYMNEFQNNQQAMRTRLGIGRSGNSRGSHLADLAVNTAVRATVWQSIAAVFRLFR